VTITVLDSETHKPITSFSYVYEIKTAEAEYDPLLVRPIEVRSDKGEFTLMAPESCEIEVQAGGGNLIGGYGSWHSYNLMSDNKLRRIEANVETGSTVTGTVVDDKTGKPIADASVAPDIFVPPISHADRQRAVKTDAAGKFTLHGVEKDLGIRIWHPDYHESYEGPGKQIAKNVYSTAIRLETGERFFGVVNDPAGKPLAGVKVSDLSGKETRTKTDGSFVLNGPRKYDDHYRFSFEKTGYLEEKIEPKLADGKRVTISLRPLPMISGTVVDAKGRPVKRFYVSAGPGKAPSDWCCKSIESHDPAGHFSIPVRTDYDFQETRKVWIGVDSDDSALWETTIGVADLSRPIVVRLSPGVTMRGVVKRPKDSSGEITAMILPNGTYEHSSEIAVRQELGRAESPIDAGGKFHFDHLAPGEYVLVIAGPKISPIRTIVTVGSKEVDAGTFSPRGRGTVDGVIYEYKMICEGEKCRLDEKRGTWAFAEGYITFPESGDSFNSTGFKQLEAIPFRADEHGRIHVENVPIGEVSVEIPYHATADIIGSHTQKTTVHEGKTSEVRFFDPKDGK
jgi:hypothetical protein